MYIHVPNDTSSVQISTHRMQKITILEISIKLKFKQIIPHECFNDFGLIGDKTDYYLGSIMLQYSMLTVVVSVWGQ